MTLKENLRKLEQKYRLEHYPYYSGTDVVGKVSGQCGGGNAEKEDTLCYQQVCGGGWQNRLKTVSLKAVREGMLEQ